MRLFYQNRVVNWHEHVWFTPERKLDEKRCAGLIEDAERTGTDTWYSVVRKTTDSRITTGQ